MLVTFAEYKNYGYMVVSETAYPRYQAMAESDVNTYCQGRVTQEAMTELNKFGVCELVDRYFIGQNPQCDAAQERQVITSFSNGKYSETYMGSRASDEASLVPDRKSIDSIIHTYFAPEQIWRGRDHARGN